MQTQFKYFLPPTLFSIRLCTLTGSPEAIVAAKAQVDAVIRNDNGRQGGGGRPPMGGGGGEYPILFVFAFVYLKCR